MYYIVLQLVIAYSISNTLFTYIGSKTITCTTYLGCRLDAIKLAVKVGLSCDSAHPHMKPIYFQDSTHIFTPLLCLQPTPHLNYSSPKKYYVSICASVVSELSTTDSFELD